MKKQQYLIMSLAILLVVAVVVIVVMQVNASNNKKLQATYQLGVKGGYEFAVKQLMGQLTACQPVPVHVDNETLNVIAVECLQQPQTPPIEQPPIEE